MSCSPYKNIALGLFLVINALNKIKIHTAIVIMEKVAQCFAVKSVNTGSTMSV